MQKVLDVSGKPILEVYSFMAKDLVYKDLKDIESDYNTGDNSDDDSNEEDYDVYRVVNLDNIEEVNMLREYCKIHPKTIGLGVRSEHNISAKKDEITITIESYNNTKHSIEKVAIELIDQRITSNIKYSTNKVDNKT